jgi:hypothetical protein
VITIHSVDCGDLERLMLTQLIVAPFKWLILTQLKLCQLVLAQLIVAPLLKWLVLTQLIVAPFSD